MKYFEKISQNKGINMVDNNPCSLLNFGKLILSGDDIFSSNSEGSEIMLVILGGKCTVKAGNMTFENIGKRPNVFSGKPYSVYIPCKTEFTVSPVDGGAVEIALCFAPSELECESYVITPDEVESGKWGISNFSRNFHGINVNTTKHVRRLIVGETYTPSGNWSTYPAHKHEVDNLPKEVYMEEMYYFKVNTPEGFGLAKYYTEDLSIDEAYTVKNETILMMPKGYHTVVSAPGYMTYYLWFLAGNCRIQCPVTDPDQAWVNKAVPMIKNIEDNLG